MAVPASEARRSVASLFQQVNDDANPVEITSKAGSAVLLSLADYEALLSIAEDQAIAPLVAERLAAGGGRPFDELLNELGMSDKARSSGDQLPGSPIA